MQEQRGLIEPHLLVAVLQKLCPLVRFHLEASVWMECYSTQKAQWSEHRVADPQSNSTDRFARQQMDNVVGFLVFPQFITINLNICYRMK